MLIGFVATHTASAFLVFLWEGFVAATSWLLSSSAAAAWIYRRFIFLLPLNRTEWGGMEFPDLGAANRITLLRGLLVTLVAGFAMIPWPEMTTGPLPWPWIPGVLYGAAVLLDGVDGRVARRTGRVTKMGEKLDMETDALGLLAASVVAVVAGRLPPAYLAAGLAYYLFGAGIRIRRLLKKPSREVQPWQGARVIAGCQMALAAAALLPPVGPPATTLAAWIVMIPLLAGFARDWLIVCGRAANDCFTSTGWGRWIHRLATSWGPIGARIAAVGFGTVWGVAAPGAVHPQGAALMIGVGLMAVGWMGRTAAAATAWISGGMLTSGGSGAWAMSGMFTCALIVLMAGTGPGSLWRPEDRFFFRVDKGTGP